MNIVDCDQRSAAWFSARAGRVTASRIADLMARTKSGPSASRANYCAELVCQRLTGTVEQGFQSAAMLRGTELEPQARDAYKVHALCDVSEIGFVVHPRIEWAGASPDGIIGEDGMVELKVPNASTHIDYLLTDMVPQKYLYQMQWQMACCDRQWADFASYCPMLPEPMQLFVKRIARDDDLIAELEREVSAFLNEVHAKHMALRGRFEDLGPAYSDGRSYAEQEAA